MKTKQIGWKFSLDGQRFHEYKAWGCIMEKILEKRIHDDIKKTVIWYRQYDEKPKYYFDEG